MDKQEKRTSRSQLPQSAILANQALREMEKNGFVKTICPKCRKTPKVTMSLNGERLTVLCECGYICSGEIYF